MRTIIALPSLLTLANAFCGLLAIAKGIDALALSNSNAALFYAKMEAACWLILLGMVFDALDGKVARFTGGASAFGAQLDSFSDALTFGCAPALLAKMLIEHEGPLRGYLGHPRLHFLAAAAFALMAILRLVRFNLENEPEDESDHVYFKGLPSPAAAGAVASTILLYLIASWPELETETGTRTPLGLALAFFEIPISVPAWFLPGIAILLPILGFLMVSRVRYVHAVSYLTRRGTFFTLVYLVFGAFLFFAAPIPILFLAFNAFWIGGVVRALLFRRSQLAVQDEPAINTVRRP